MSVEFWYFRNVLFFEAAVAAGLVLHDFTQISVCSSPAELFNFPDGMDDEHSDGRIPVSFRRSIAIPEFQMAP